MKKSYTKPEIEMVEYKANDVIMLSTGNYDNNLAWLTAWSTSKSNTPLDNF